MIDCHSAVLANEGPLVPHSQGDETPSQKELGEMYSADDRKLLRG